MDHPTLLDLRPDLKDKVYRHEEAPYPFKRIFVEDLLRLRDFFQEHFQGATFLVNDAPVNNPWAIEHLEPDTIQSIGFEHPRLTLHYGLDGIRYRYEKTNEFAFNQKRHRLLEQIESALQEHKRRRVWHRRRIAKGVVLVEGLVLGACLVWYSPLFSVAVIGLTLASLFVEEPFFLNLMGTAFWAVMIGLFFQYSSLNSGMLATLTGVATFMIYLGHCALYDLLDSEYG